MKISTRGRYALRVLADMAERFNGEYIPLKDIALRQDISQKYLEGIMLLLSKNGIVEGVHGKGGGYKLKKSPENCTVLEVLVATEGSLAPVSCLENGAPVCEKTANCKTIALWTDFYSVIKDFFGSKTLKDLTNSDPCGEYVI